MGSRIAIIHCEPRVPWQPKRAAFFAEGFKRAGIPVRITNERERLDEGFPVLLGTTFWRQIENDGGEYLLVDRCSFGDTNTFVSLVWNGHGRRGDHRVPSDFDGSRWKQHGTILLPWRLGSQVILCGQMATYSPAWQSVDAWYASVKATHFRAHPAGKNPTSLPVSTDFDDCRAAVTLNSSIGVQCVLAGIPTITMDEGAMAWDVTGHSLDSIRMPDREPWCHWLAWTQWSDDEIREGIPWAYLL